MKNILNKLSDVRKFQIEVLKLSPDFSLPMIKIQEVRNKLKTKY
jgi:hypothetical protein